MFEIRERICIVQPNKRLRVAEHSRPDGSYPLAHETRSSGLGAKGAYDTCIGEFRLLRVSESLFDGA